MPNGLVTLIALLVIGFIFSMVQAVQNKKLRNRYKKVDNTDAFEADGNRSYQNPSEYTPSSTQKVVTYSVIDGRLVDK
jgi:hypothetical protein